MKKQFQIFAATFVSIAIVSCSKQHVEMPGATQATTEEMTTSNNSSSVRTIDPLLVNLDGWFKFNGNLKDQLKKLPDGISTGRGVLYTTDRKGALNSAINFNGSYGVNLFKVPQQMHSSISVWVKYYNANLGTGRSIVSPKAKGLGVHKFQAEIGGSIESLPEFSMWIPVDNVSKAWHHFVVTFDDETLRFYMDGQLVKTSQGEVAVSYPSILQDYLIGYRGTELFEGSVDDLRFYSRTLTASDVQKLYNL